MSDIASFWNVDEMFADWQKGLGELTTGNDLQTAILDSLFTDRLARADDDYEDSDRRGWWGDSDADTQLGSRLWVRSPRAPLRAVRLRSVPGPG